MTAVKGLYVGPAREAWRTARPALSAQVHVVWVDQPFTRVLSVMPPMYDDLWTAAKGMYKLEPVVADGGEVVIYAPHITEVSYTHGAIDRRDRLPLPRLLRRHSGTASGTTRAGSSRTPRTEGHGHDSTGAGVERPRVSVSLATGISEERCRRLNLGYVDPASIRLDDWRGRERDGVLVVPRAGEQLYRLRQS